MSRAQQAGRKMGSLRSAITRGREGPHAESYERKLAAEVKGGGDKGFRRERISCGARTNHEMGKKNDARDVVWGGKKD